MCGGAIISGYVPAAQSRGLTNADFMWPGLKKTTQKEGKKHYPAEVGADFGFDADFDFDFDADFAEFEDEPGEVSEDEPFFVDTFKAPFLRGIHVFFFFLDFFLFFLFPSHYRSYTLKKVGLFLFFSIFLEFFPFFPLPLL